ncbi:hypothetical protein VCRA2110O2_30206 [Vibrio crassostreae]|nr:hypothetical protein VCHA44O286_50169 [Vibrio chagasii]CAK2860930.1 hypothetical protein VCRA2110O2_30206 [Vibrio crassostreae]
MGARCTAITMSIHSANTSNWSLQCASLKNPKTTSNKARIGKASSLWLWQRALSILHYLKLR